MDTATEHRIITQGPMNVRDWRVTCLCLERFVGPGAKAAKALWEEHVKEQSRSPNHRPLPAVDDREGDWCVTCGLPVIWDPRRVEFQHERPKP